MLRRIGSARHGCTAGRARSASASAAAQAGTLRGTVADSSGAPLPNAAVTVEGTGLRATTGADGSYEIRGVPAGTYTVRARAHRLPGRRGAGDDRRPATRSRAGLHPGPEHGPARPDRRGRRLPRAAHRGRGAGGAGGRLPGGAAPAAGQHRDQRHPPVGVALDQLPPPERDRRRRHRAAVHPARPEPGPHAGAGERLAAAPDGAGQQLHLRHGRGLERRGPERAPVERARPDRGAARRRRGPVRLRRDRRRGQPGAQGRRLHPLRQRRRRPLHHRRLSRRRHHGRTSTAAGASRSAAASLGLFGEYRDRQPTNRAWADPFEDAGHRRHRRRSTTRARSSRRATRCRSPITTGATGWSRTSLAFANFRMPVNEAGSSEIYASAATATGTGPGNGLPAERRQQPELAGDLSAGLPAGDQRPSRPTTRRRAGCGAGVRLELRPGRRVRAQRLRLRHPQHPQRLARPLPGRCPARQAPTASSALRTIRVSPTSCRSSPAGCCARSS